MSRTPKTLNDPSLLEATLEGLLLQKQRIEQQIQEVRSLLGRRRSSGAATESAAGTGGRGRRELSEAARKRIAAAQKKRWAEYRKQRSRAEKNAGGA